MKIINWVQGLFTLSTQLGLYCHFSYYYFHSLFFKNNHNIFLYMYTEFDGSHFKKREKQKKNYYITLFCTVIQWLIRMTCSTLHFFFQFFLWNLCHWKTLFFFLPFICNCLSNSTIKRVTFSFWVVSKREWRFCFVPWIYYKLSPQS